MRRTLVGRSGRQVELGEVDAVEAGEAVGDRLGDRVRLLVDLLEHEGLVAALLGGVLVPVDRFEIPLHRFTGGGGERRAVRLHRDHLAVLHELHLSGLGEERGNRRCHEALPVAATDDQRALLPGGDERMRVLAMQRDEGVVPAQVAEGRAHGRSEVSVVVPLDQVRDDLGVGLRAEHVAVRGQVTAKLRVVLDDSVEDDLHVV